MQSISFFEYLFIQQVVTYSNGKYHDVFEKIEYNAKIKDIMNF